MSASSPSATRAPLICVKGLDVATLMPTIMRRRRSMLPLFKNLWTTVVVVLFFVSCDVVPKAAASTTTAPPPTSATAGTSPRRRRHPSHPKRQQEHLPQPQIFRFLDNRSSSSLQQPQPLITVPSVTTASQQSSVDLSAEASRQRHRDDQIMMRSRNQYFTCLLTASAGFANVRAQSTYGSLLNLCSGNLLRLGSLLASRLYHGSSSKSATSISSSTLKSLFIPLAVLFGYVVGTSLARLSHHAIATEVYNETAQEREESLSLPAAAAAPLPVPLQLRPWLQATIRQWHLPRGRCRSQTATMSVTQSVVWAIVPWIVSCFVGADIVGMLLIRSAASTASSSSSPLSVFVWTIQALLQAVAYGMIHLAASDAVGGMVLFAVTGHLAGATKASVDTLSRQERSTPVPESLTATSSSSYSLARHNAQMVLFFFIGGTLGSLVWDHVLPALPAAATRYLPLHSLTGLFYAAMFLWYGRPL